MLNSKHYPYIPVANVFTNFLKEIKPFQKYSVSSRIICWDEKWIYVMSRFTIKKGTVLCSLSLTKYVLKDGRKTIKPKDALEYCGLYNEKVAKISEDNLKLLTERCGFHETVPLENLSQEYCSEI
ncbi:YBR096W-like protein [Saccharomyces cerevisiae Lalvin QA23]|nr:YBR096W-like protein [Saccharomyces cerevisiae Lalvin QA23]